LFTTPEAPLLRGRAAARRPELFGDTAAAGNIGVITEVKKRMGVLLVIVLVLLLIGAFPAWPYSRGWGYYPSSGLGLILLIVIILAVTGTRF
jgi:Protein of unknown function (DUF3309)